MNNRSSVQRFSSPKQQQQQDLNDSAKAMRWIQKPPVAVRRYHHFLPIQQSPLCVIKQMKFYILIMFNWKKENE